MKSVLTDDEIRLLKLVTNSHMNSFDFVWILNFIDQAYPYGQIQCVYSNHTLWSTYNHKKSTCEASDFREQILYVFLNDLLWSSYTRKWSTCEAFLVELKGQGRYLAWGLKDSGADISSVQVQLEKHGVQHCWSLWGSFMVKLKNQEYLNKNSFLLRNQGKPI